MRSKTDVFEHPLRPTEGHFYTPGALESLERAAARLGCAPEPLRADCERRAEHCGNVAVAHLDGGVVAFKCGEAWRFRLPVVAPAADASERGAQ
jgi:hypothetical protein